MIYMIVNNVDLKTTNIFEKYKNDFKNNVLYLPRFDRRFILTKDQMISFDSYYKMLYDISFKDMIEYTLDLRDPFTYEKMDKDDVISNGYMQAFNILYSFLFLKPKIFIVDKIELNFHPLLARKINNFIINQCLENNCTAIITTDDSLFLNDKAKVIDTLSLEKIIMDVINDKL